MGIFDKLKAGLARTARQFQERFDAIVATADAPEKRTRAVDVETLDALEELLIMSDVGVAATDEIVEAVRLRARRGESLRELVTEEILRIFNTVGGPVATNARPHVMLIVGVNGTGKTTTVGKIANQLKSEGRTPLICAADTFRAAAVDQLQIWADRAGVELVRSHEGGDPSAVVFDAVERAASKDLDLVLADTAGRLHTKTNLMEELRKVRRVAEKGAGTVTEALLVVDATTGQNGMAQAREFGEATQLTGVVLTKLDGSAKGGIVFAIETELGIPVKLVGLGETIDDLMPFDSDEFVDALFSAP